MFFLSPSPIDAFIPNLLIVALVYCSCKGFWKGMKSANGSVPTARDPLFHKFWTNVVDMFVVLLIATILSGIWIYF